MRGGITLGGVIVIVGIILMIFWNFWLPTGLLSFWEFLQCSSFTVFSSPFIDWSSRLLLVFLVPKSQLPPGGTSYTTMLLSLDNISIGSTSFMTNMVCSMARTIQGLPRLIRSHCPNQPLGAYCSRWRVSQHPLRRGICEAHPDLSSV